MHGQGRNTADDGNGHSAGGPAAASHRLSEGHSRTRTRQKTPALSATEKAAIEAAKVAGAQARAELDAPSYEPSIFRRFPDEPARYDYLFTALHKRGAELVPEDAAFMEYFENSQQFKNNFKALYDARLELLQFRKGQYITTA